MHISVPLTDDVGSVIASYIHRESESESDSSDNVENMTDRSRLITPTSLSVRYFDYRHARYIWSSREGSYVRLYGLDKGHPINKFTTDYIYGITREEQMGKRAIYGSNSVDVEVKSYATLFIQEVGTQVLIHFWSFLVE